MSSIRLMVGVAAVALSFLASETAIAQSGDMEGQGTSRSDDAAAPSGEIVVTAQRRSQSLGDVPLAISAISGDALDSKGIKSAADLGNAVPNLQVNSPQGRWQPNFALRGISVANEYNPNQASPIGVYADDAYLPFRTSHGAQLFDLDRVEVLRGPQGTLYGRNTTGGAINMISRSPSLSDVNGYVQFGYGYRNRFAAQGAVDLPIVTDRFAVRAAADYVKGDGLFKNRNTNGADPAGEDSFLGRIVLLAKPSDKLTLKSRVYYSDTSSTQNPVHAIGTAPGGAFIPQLGGYGRAGIDFFEVDTPDVGKMNIKTWGANLKVDWQVADGLTITSLTTYDYGKYAVDINSTQTPLDILTIHWRGIYKDAGQELRAQYGSSSLDVVVGASYGWDKIAAHNVFDSLFFIGNSAPFDPNLMSSAFAIDQSFVQTRRSYAAFSQADVRLAPGLTLTAGLRYSKDKAKYADGRAFVTDFNRTPLVQTIPFQGAYDPNASLPTRYGDNSAVTGKLGLSYQFPDSTLLFASYSRGYRSGAFNGNGYLDSSQIQYVHPEKVDAYELGIKGKLADRRIDYSLSSFLYDYTDQQLQEIIGFVGFLRNAGKARLYGAELEVAFHPVGSLDINLSGSYLYSRYNDLKLSGFNLSGNQLPFAPKWSFNADVNWRFAHVAGGDLFVQASYSHKGKHWFSPFNDQNGAGPLSQDGYGIVNARIGIDTDRYSLSLWAKNLFDRKYYSYGIDLRGAAGSYYFVPADPRTYGVEARLKF